MPTLSLKKGDTVRVLSGKDKGTAGKIIFVDPKRSLATVEGVNIRVRHQRPKRQGQKGQTVRLPYPLPRARLMLICPNCGKPTRIARSINEAGKKMRMCKKCKSTF